jgi:hypothetical protein
MTHFTDLELHHWRESGPGADRDRALAHLAECVSCASRYANAVRSRPLRAEPVEDAGEFIRAGNRFAEARRPWILPAAVAGAALIVMFSVPLAMRREPPTPELPLRGAAIQPLAPIGSVRVAEFVWASGVAALRYRIEVGQRNRVIFTADTSESRFVMPASRLKPGLEYWWSVSAIDDHGRPAMSSPRRAFTILR